MTNGDKIRAMTDEELVSHRFANGWCSDDVPCNRIGTAEWCNGMTPCEQCYYKWLKEEVKE